MDFNANAMHGGEAKETKYEPTTNVEIEKYHALKTRPLLQKYEFDGAITQLAQYCENLRSVGQFADVSEINNFTNPAELAYHLYKAGKVDVIIIRNGGEKVSMSTLRIDPFLEKYIDDYFKLVHDARDKEFFAKVKSIL